MSTGRVPIEIFCVSGFFYRKFVEKNFRRRGPQKSTIFGLFSKIDVGNFGHTPPKCRLFTLLKCLMHKNPLAQKWFFGKGHKIPMRGPPIEISGESKFFYRNSVEKIFRFRGAKKSTIFGLFSKIDPRNYCQLGKNVFFEISFF